MTLHPVGAGRTVLAVLLMLGALGALAQEPVLDPQQDGTEGGRPPVHPDAVGGEQVEGGRPPVHPESVGGEQVEGGRPPVHPESIRDDGAGGGLLPVQPDDTGDDRTDGGRPPVHPDDAGDDRTEGGRPPVHPQLVGGDGTEGGRPPVHPQCVDSYGLCLMGAADVRSLQEQCKPMYKRCKRRRGEERAACARTLAQCELDAAEGGRPPVHPNTCHRTLSSCQASLSTD